MPGHGIENLHPGIRDKLTESNIESGRNRFLKFCHHHYLLVTKTWRGFTTNGSNHHYHKSTNLIKEPATFYVEVSISIEQ